MKERILEFLKKENKSSVQFAEEIGVQPSGISHILSGRNKPSLDFILKMLAKYQFLSVEWLLFGKGTMYKDQRMPTLFDFNEENRQEHGNDPGISEEDSQSDTGSVTGPQKKSSEIKKIVWFYENSTFEEFSPGKE